MNTDMLVRQFATENDMTLKDARKYIFSMLDIMEEGLLSYGRVKLHKHFSIKVVDIPEKTMWSNLYHKFMKCGGYVVLKISPSEQLDDRLNRLYRRVRGADDE